MLSVSSEEGAAVLIRALEPLEGLSLSSSYLSCWEPERERGELMEENRKQKMKAGSEKKLNATDLCSGPAKLTQSLMIKRDKVQHNSIFDLSYIQFYSNEK